MVLSMRSKSRRTAMRAPASGTVAALWILPFAAAAQTAPEPDRFEYRVGAQAFSSFDSAIRLDSRTRGAGTEIRLEQDVNLEERVDVVRADAVYNFNSRHYVWFAAYDVERTGMRDVARELRFGDETFTVAATVSASLEERIAKVSYGFNAVRRPRATFGPSFGLHIMRLEAGLGIAGTPLVQEASTTAPLPVIGVRGDRRLSERWRLQGALQWFDVQVGDVDGLFSDFIVTVEHDTFDRFGFGFGINNNTLDIESGDDDFRGRIDLSFRSAVVYFKGSVGRRSLR